VGDTLLAVRDHLSATLIRLVRLRHSCLQIE
jgi:hypothetical protein